MKIAASVTSAGPIRVRACVFPVLFAALLSGCSLWGGSKVKLPELGENVPLLGVRQAWSAKLGGGRCQTFGCARSGPSCHHCSCGWQRGCA